jgi:hypothetical protein
MDNNLAITTFSTNEPIVKTPRCLLLSKVFLFPHYLSAFFKTRVSTKKINDSSCILDSVGSNIGG